MATINLASLEAAADAASPATELTTIGKSLTTRIAAPIGIDADLDTSDVRLPRLNLIQKSSELAEVEGWNPGDIAFVKEVKLIPFGQSGKVTFIHLKRQFQEYIPWGSDVRPRVFNTREEVEAAGGSTEFKAVNEYRPIAHFTMLIEKPTTTKSDAVLDSYFPLEFNGKFYSLAAWTVASSAYKRTADQLISAAKMFMRDGIHRYPWELSVEKDKSGTNTFFVPSIKRAGVHSPEMVEFIENLL